MRKLFKLNALVFMAFFSLFLLSCNDDDENVMEEEMSTDLNIVGTAQATADLSLLVDALIQADADLVATLSSDGPFTVFAPTNAAFAALLQELGDDYNSLADFDTPEEKELLAKVLTYHVVAGTAAFSGDLTNGMMITTVQGEDITVNLDGGVFISDATETNAEVVTADVATTNGVVHVIDKVLLPQEVLDALSAPTQNIVETAIATPALSLLVEALLQADADLEVVLSGDGPFTVFAPSNDAFEALLNDLGYSDLSEFDTADEKALLVKVLTYHVVSGTAALSTDLMQDLRIETFQGENVSVDLNGGVFIGDATDTTAEVIIPDVVTTNGVVHVIDKVLLPQEVLNTLTPPTQNIVETAQATAALSLLVDALIQADADLVATLSGDGPFTVFAPTNDAFAALLDILGNDYNSLEDFDTPAEKELLAKVLTYHVVAGTAAYATNLNDGMMITTVQGEDVTVNLAGGVFIGDATDTDAQVVIANVATTNGAVHVINKVLLPQEVLDALGL